MKAILSDLDNTLVDFMRMKRACAKAALEAMAAAGLEIDADKAFDELMKIYFEVGIEHDRIFQEYLQRIAKAVDYKVLAAGIIAYRKTQQGYMKPFPGVVPTLIKLKEKGVKLAVVTDAPKLKAWIRLTELGLQDFFDVVVTFDDTGERKPSPKPFRKALELLKVKPSEALMIGDWPERDMVSAKAVGVKTCFARYGWQFQTPPPEKGKSGADVEAESVKDLLKVVESA